MNPFDRFLKDLKKAEKAGLVLANAMTLATADRQGKPSVRMMLLKGVDKDGFVFYTNLGSRKAFELLNRRRASLCFWWPALKEQVRVEGRIEPVSAKEADAYFQTRPRGSQLAAWASRQSHVLSSRRVLMRALKEVRMKFDGSEIPRPPFWSGFRLIPARIEFWFDRADRLHERVLYTRRRKRWVTALLYP